METSGVEGELGPDDVVLVNASGRVVEPRPTTSSSVSPTPPYDELSQEPLQYGAYPLLWVGRSLSRRETLKFDEGPGKALQSR